MPEGPGIRVAVIGYPDKLPKDKLPQDKLPQRSGVETEVGGREVGGRRRGRGSKAAEED